MDYLEEKRIASGKSTREIYEALEVDRITLYRYERGIIKNIPRDKLIKLSEILNFSIDEYFQNVN
ncbi:MAG: helix-turn-helix domain-containing protein [Paraclostridium sp.]